MTRKDDLIRRSVRILTYYRRQIGWITSRVVVLATAFTLLTMAVLPKYVAKTTLTLLPSRSELGFAAKNPETWGLSPATMLAQTHEETLTSLTVAENTARILLKQDSAELNNGGFTGAIRRKIVSPITSFIGSAVRFLNTGRWAKSDPLVSFAQLIQSRTSVKNVPGSFVFQVSVTWDSPKLAARVANLITEQYIDLTLQENREEMKSTSDYLQARVAETESDLAALETKIQDYRVSKKFYSSSRDMEIGLEELSGYMKSLTESRVNWEQLDAKVNTLKNFQAPSSLVAVQAERSALKAKQDTVQKVVDEQIAKLDALPAKESGLLDLYRDRLLKERALSGLDDRLLDAKVSEAAQLSAARVIDPAIIPTYPHKPLLVTNVLAAVVVGLLLSMGFILVSETRRPGLRSVDDLPGTSGKDIGVIPFLGTDSPREVRTGRMQKMSECCRVALCPEYGTPARRETTKRHLEHLFLQLMQGGAATNICLLVSLNGREGKTFIIDQMASLVAGSGHKVLLVDGNMTTPGLHQRFGKAIDAGFREMLAGKTKVDQAIVHVAEGVDLISAGTTLLSPQGKWAIDKVKADLMTLASRYDLVLIDSSHMRLDASALRLVPLATEILCVFDATSSKQNDLQQVQERLRGVNKPVLFVLNKVLHDSDHLFAVNGDTHAGQSSSGSPVLETAAETTWN